MPQIRIRQAIVIAALLVVAAVARADQGPLLRAGEWSTVVTFDGGKSPPGPPRHACETSDHVMDKATFTALMARAHLVCPRLDFGTAGQVTTFSMTCNSTAAKDMTLQANGTMTNDGPDGYTLHEHTHAQGGSVRIPDMDITSVSRRVGACTPEDAAKARADGR